MRSAAPSLLPIFRSRHQAQLLAQLYLQPGREATMTDLATAIGAPLTTTVTELNRLVDAGLLIARTLGRARLVQAACDHPAARPLTELLQLMFGPPAVLTAEFTDLPGLAQLVLFGSWAARDAGIPGPPPADLDVLVVGNPRRADVYAAADRAQTQLGTPVNPVLRTSQQWAATDTAADALVADIRTTPHLLLLDSTSDEQTAATHTNGGTAEPAASSGGGNA